MHTHSTDLITIKTRRNKTSLLQQRLIPSLACQSLEDCSTQFNKKKSNPSADSVTKYFVYKQYATALNNFQLLMVKPYSNFTHAHNHFSDAFQSCLIKVVFKRSKTKKSYKIIIIHNKQICTAP